MKEAKENANEKQTAPLFCPLAQCGCFMMQRQPEAPVAETEPVAHEEAPAAEEVAADTVEEEPLSLRESLALAKEMINASVVNKKYVADYLTERFGKEVECNMRGNYTKTSLPLADTHYAIGEKGKKCFIYVYETDAAVVLLLRLTDEYAETVRAGGHRIIRSAFPKSKDSWYSIIVDDTYAEADIQEILVDAYNMAK